MKVFLIVTIALLLSLTSCATNPPPAAMPSNAPTVIQATPAANTASAADGSTATATQSSPAASQVAPTEPAAFSIPSQVDGWASAPASTRELIGRVDELAKTGNWKGAWDLLVAADPQHKDPWNLARSIELMLDGYIDSNLHVAFILEDIPPNITIAQARSAGQGLGDIDFSPGAMAEAQVASGIAAVPALQKSLGRYYAEVIRLYPGKWLLPDEEVVKRSLEAFTQARDAGVYDIGSLQSEAETLLNSGGAPMAESLLIAAEKLDSSSIRVRYDHAVSLLMQNRPTEAYPIVDDGIALDTDPTSRISGYTIAAQAATMAGDAPRAESYLAAAEKEAPDRPEPGLFRHYLAVMKGDNEAALSATQLLLDRLGARPQLISSLVGTWFQSGAADMALAFIDAGLERYANEDEAAGAFGFYKAVVIMQTASTPTELEACLAPLDAAEARFHKAYPPENSVFGIITNVRQEIAAQLAKAEAEAGAAMGPQLPPAEGAPSPAP